MILIVEFVTRAFPVNDDVGDRRAVSSGARGRASHGAQVVERRDV
jgi:hypothetical protein